MKKATAGNLNALLLKGLLSARAAATKARAEADIASANADLVRAKIEAAGKQIRYDYENGVERLSVIDVIAS